MTRSTRSLRNARIAIVVVVLLVLAGAYHFGIFARVAEPKILALARAHARRRGPARPLCEESV